MLSELRKGDLRLIVTRLPKDVVTQIKEHGLLLGGGFIRATIAGEAPSDIDLFGESKNQLDKVAKHLKEHRPGAYIHSSGNALTLVSLARMPIQFIHRWLFKSATECVESFDFTVAQAVVWYEDKEWHSTCHEDFYVDLAARRLTYCAPARNEDAGGSLLRVRKFLKRGYNIQAESLAKVLARLYRAVDWKKIEDEEGAAKIIHSLLLEVDPLHLVDGLDVVDEHSDET